MGFSTPKPPFNLADFLAEKGTPRSRRPTWKRGPARAPANATSETAAVDADDRAETTDSE